MAESVFSRLLKPLRREIESLEWGRATRIQELAIPEILEGNNVLLIAPTGTGKTEAAVLPVFEQLLHERSKAPIRGISILYVTPLRALNRDIFRRLIDIGEHLDIRVQVRHGDTSQQVRRMQALKPPDMLITTPETLQAILPGKNMQRNLREVRWVIVDEIHELATDERGVQLSLGLERLAKTTGREFQRIGLSATIGSPELVSHFLVGNGRSCKVLRSIEAKDTDVRVESPTSTNEDEEAAKNLMIPAGSIRRIRRLLELVEKYKSTLVFTNTREHAEALSSRVNALQPDSKIGVHHGSLSKEVRIETENELKEGKLKAVICTSSLELGIDVGNIEFVIQYMSPRQVTKLTQRVGRSGHVIGAKSNGCILAAWPDDILESAVITKFASEGFLEPLKVHDGALDVLAHQIAGMVLDWGRMRLEDIYQIACSSWAYRNLSQEKLLAVVKQLESRRIIWFDGDSVRKRYPNLFSYYYENLSMIPDVKHYDVVDFLNRRRIGTLDQEFIARNGKPGQEFIIHGQTWRIISIDEEKSLVQVEPVPQSFGAIPAWEGEIIPVPFDVAQEVGRLRRDVAERIRRGEEITPVFKGYPLDQEAMGKVVEFVGKQVEGGYDVPTDKRIVIECFENYVVVHACFGDLVNEALGMALASILSARSGFNVATQADAYRISFISPGYIDPEVVKKDLAGLRPDELEQILASVLEDTSLLAWRLWNVAKRFGLVSRDAEYNSGRGRLLATVLQGTPVYEEAVREIYVEKMDVENAKKILGIIQSEEIEVVALPRTHEYSPFALPILDRIAPHDMLRPVVPTKAIMDVVKERLNSGEARLVCVFKADYDGVRNLRSLPEKIRCPNCGYTLVAATYPSDRALINVARKKVAGKKLTAEEEKRWQSAWKSASLVQTYGKKAILVLNGRGVGPTTAARILHSYHRSEEELYLDIIRAERNYLRTRMFWDR